MANRRMFALSVVESDAFLDLSIEARAAYFHLGMHTDDDGFVGNPRTVCRVAGVPLEVVDELAEVGFVTVFDSGVIHVSHFSTNNSIRTDRYTPTEHQNEKMALDQGADAWQPSDNQTATNEQPNISKEREAEASSGEGSLSQINLSQASPIQESAGAPRAPYPAHAREEPTIDDVRAYAATLPWDVPNIHGFMNRMQISGWCGDWREALEEWEG